MDISRPMLTCDLLWSLITISSAMLMVQMVQYIVLFVICVLHFFDTKFELIFFSVTRQSIGVECVDR